MTKDLAALAARVQRLEDERAVAAVIAAYGPLADQGDAAAVARLWTEVGTYEVVGFATARGRDAIAALIEGPTHRALMADGCAHLLGPVAVTVEGDAATAVGHSVVFRHDAARFVVERVSANRWQMVRTAEGWRVAARVNALLDGQAAARALLALPPG